MSRVAVIGSGISGLAAAWLLSRKHEVTLYEREPRLGGHTHTHEVEDPAGVLNVDSGFIVFNEVNYPLLCRLFRELDVPTAPSDMSFSVSTRPRGLAWSSRGLGGLFSQRLNLLRPRFWKFLGQIARFNREAPRLLDRPGAEAVTLGDWLGQERFSDDFRDHYLVPMSAAVWSTPAREMLRFPAATLVRFFGNHGFLGVTTQHPWRTIPGGCSRYIEPLLRPFRERLHVGHPVTAVHREPSGATVHAEGLAPARFDEVVFAVHGDQVLPMLTRPTRDEEQVFRAFSSNRNEAALHTDAGLMPPRRRTWASWNHVRIAGAEDRLVVTYHMNRLQSLGARRNWFVSLNAEGLLVEDRVVRRMTYEHPRYTPEAVRAQGRWADVSGRNRTHYCGAYWGYGFHEDGLKSAVRVAQRMGVEW
jgi:predicted NAD/FAD-binding protein